MKKLKVGRVYHIKYDQKGTSSVKTDYSYVSLKGQELLKLVSDVTKNAPKTEAIYEKCKHDFAAYIYAIEGLARVKAYKKANHRRKKSIVEVEHEYKIALMRKRLFKKSKKIITDREKARNLFIRVLDVSRITFMDLDTEDKDAFDVLYAGKMYTHKGNTVHKFYFLQPIKIEKIDIPEAALPYLDVSE